jgi:hypothetical protein
MKHWTKIPYNLSDWWVHNSDAIVLSNEERIISISKLDGKVCIAEECDGAFVTTLTKEEAIEAFEEAIEFIKSDNT